MTSLKDYDDSNGAIEFVLPKLDLDWPPEPDTLFIHMTRGERRVRESVNKAFGNIKSVVIDVDGEKHEYDADKLIMLLEEFEVGNESGTCRNQWQWDYGFCCSECFYAVPFAGRFASKEFRYCPNCRREVSR